MNAFLLQRSGQVDSEKPVHEDISVIKSLEEI